MTHKNVRLLLIGLSYLGFVSLGLPDGLHGIAWPSIRTSFHLPLDALGKLLVSFTCGYLLSSFNSGRLLARLGVGVLLALSCLATAASLLGYALAPGWWVMVGWGLLAGLGAGAIDAGLNLYAATHFSARMVNWLHACYGFGATGGPVLMTGVLNTGHSWRWGYAVVGLAQLVLAVCFGLTHKQWAQHPVAPETAAPVGVPQASTRSTLSVPIMWLSIAVFFLYTGLEAAAGAWAYSLFTEARGIPVVTAGTWVSLYWGVFTTGRVISGLVVGFASVPSLLRYCISGMALGALLLWLPPSREAGFLGLACMGFAAAPVFPSLIATTPGRLGAMHTANGVGIQIAAAVLGGSLLPALLGIFADHIGLEVIGPGLFVVALLLLILHEALIAQSAKSLHQASGTV
ncbi:MAG TPA: MFS transporter [Candidatus Tectomicrobia bacterium]